MIGAVLVAVTLNGSLVASSHPARIVSGTVVAPLDPYVRRIATSASLSSRGSQILLDRDGRLVALAVGHNAARVGDWSVPLPIAPYVADGVIWVPLADVARALGATVHYDGRYHLLAITTPSPAPLATPTPTPTSAAVPSASPVTVFTPQPPPATAAPTPSIQPSPSPSPRPRRTPVPATPSRP